MYFVCWITKTTNAHSEYVILLFDGNSGCTNVLHCCILCTLLVLFSTHVNFFETNGEILSVVGLVGGAEFFDHSDLHCKFYAFIHAFILNYLMRLHCHVSKRLNLFKRLTHYLIF